MNETTLSQTVFRLLSERLENPPEDLALDTRLRDVGLDSILLLDLLIDVEEELGHKIPDLKMPADPCIRDVVAMIQRNIESIP